MLTFKDLEKEKAKQGEDADGISQSSSDKERKKKLILYGLRLIRASLRIQLVPMNRCRALKIVSTMPSVRFQMLITMSGLRVD
jgi:hypothetical protein